MDLEGLRYCADLERLEVLRGLLAQTWRGLRCCMDLEGLRYCADLEGIEVLHGLGGV